MSGFLRRLARPDVAAVADQGVVSLANFATGVILARSLSQDQFGLYALGLTVILLAVDLQTTVTTTPYMVLSPHLDRESRAHYLGSTSVHQIWLGLLVAVGLVGVGLFLGISQDSADLGSVLVALGAVVSFILFRDFARRINFAHLKPGAALTLDSVVTVLQLVGLFALAWTDQLTVARAFLIVGVATGVPAAAWVVMGREELKVSRPLVTRDLRRNWGFGKWLLMSGTLWSLSLYLYPWILAAVHGTAATGIWAVGVGVVAIANPLLLGYQNHLAPRIMASYAQEDSSGLRKVVTQGSWRFGAIVLPVVVVLIFLGGLVAVAIYGDAYAGNGWLVGVLAVNLLVSAVAFPYSRGLFAMERADVDFRVNLAALVSLFAIGVWLVRGWGPLGAAWGMLIANIVSTGLRARAFWRLSGRLGR
jgi:O-antigen/teichoic acid export membrane protein